MRLLSCAVLLSLITSSASVGQTPRTPMRIPRDTFVAWMSRLSNSGRWGAADQLGTLNLITPAKRRSAAQGVRDGVSISLSRDLVAGPDSNAIRPMRFGLMVSRMDSTTTAALIPLCFSHMDTSTATWMGYRTSCFATGCKMTSRSINWCPKAQKNWGSR